MKQLFRPSPIKQIKNKCKRAVQWPLGFYEKLRPSSQPVYILPKQENGVFALVLIGITRARAIMLAVLPTTLSANHCPGEIGHRQIVIPLTIFNSPLRSGESAGRASLLCLKEGRPTLGAKTSVHHHAIRGAIRNFRSANRGSTEFFDCFRHGFSPSLLWLLRHG
jgi:hypothetical protein